MDPVERVRRETARALSGGERVLVACSGGPDSRVLLDALHASGRVCHVACVDHGLRPEAAGEAEGVAAVARALGVPCTILRVHLGRPSMAAARRVRYDALVAEARAVGCDTLAVGHTATDQAETLLDRLIRGAGTGGLSAMARRRAVAPGITLVRPLLDVTRDEVEAYVSARGLEVVRDPTNRDLSYRRSRLRHEVLPLLRRERADLDRALVGLCDRLRADAAALDAEAARQLQQLQPVKGELGPSGAAGGAERSGTIDTRALGDLPDAIAARVVALAAGVPLDSVHIDAIRRLCADVRGTRSIDLPGHVVAERRYDRLRFGARLDDPGDVEIEVAGPGAYRFLADEVVIAPPAWARLAGPGALILRNFRPGDVVRSDKLKNLLIDRKVPRPLRRWLPILVRRSTFTSGADRRDEVLWIPGIFGEGPALTRRSAVQ